MSIIAHVRRRAASSLALALLAWALAPCATADSAAAPAGTPTSDHRETAMTTATPFTCLTLNDGSSLTRIEQRGIPFDVIDTGKGYRSLLPGRIEAGNQAFSRLFFLGLCTDRPDGSEWWGNAERWYSPQARVFIGDLLGRMQLVYADQTNEWIPLIFGVNVWFYELFEPLREGEAAYLNNYNNATSPEPFASDAQARALLRDALQLAPNDAVKGARYVLAIEPRLKPLVAIAMHPAGVRASMPQITAVTGLAATAAPEVQAQWPAHGEPWYTQKRYWPMMDRLARRLYQFRDELPTSHTLALPQGYNGPRVEFKGTALAELYTQVYTSNIWDMAQQKVDAEGGMHTSSTNAPNFGIYVGFGTFKAGVGGYASHLWSRDVGRSLTEVAAWGETERTRKAAEKLLTVYLYDKSLRYSHPNWKRIANAAEIAPSTDPNGMLMSVSGKENDGHGALMLFIYRMAQQGTLDTEWLRAHWKNLSDAAEWYGWQIEHPTESGFDGVLWSESEASTGQLASPDLFSNAQAMHGLLGFARIARQLGETQAATRWEGLAATLRSGILTRFTGEHPRYGRIFTDTTDDCWTWEYKAQAPLFLHPDLTGYDMAETDPEFQAIATATYRAQKELYFSYASGRQMGYGQGYITEAAILVDNPTDMQGYLEQAAAFCYHHSDYPYIVPEGVICHPSGRFWFRNGDLGNSVQQAEIVKCGRLLLGLDDLAPEQGLRLVPRLPLGWTELSARQYPVTAQVGGQRTRVPVDYAARRIDGGYEVELTATAPLPLKSLRLGPWPAGTRRIKLHGLRGAEPRLVEREGQVFAYLDLQGTPRAALKVRATAAE